MADAGGVTAWASSILGFKTEAPPAADVGIKDELSSFPVPGEGKNRLVFVEFEFDGDNEAEKNNSETQQQQNARSQYGHGGVGSGGSIDSNMSDGGYPQGHSAGHAMPPHFESAGRDEDGDEEDANVSDSDHEPDERNKYWMPDRLCKVCYDCEQPFTVIRRRHHCRMCGQVFCHSCSPYVVDGRALGELGSVRACKLCHDQQAESSVDALAQNRRRAPLAKATSSSSSSSALSSASSSSFKKGMPAPTAADTAASKQGRIIGPSPSANYPKGGGVREGAAGASVAAAAPSASSALSGAAPRTTPSTAAGPSGGNEEEEEEGEEGSDGDRSGGINTPSRFGVGGGGRSQNMSVDLGEGALGTAVREPGSAAPSLAGLASLAEMNLQQQFDVVSPSASNSGRAASGRSQPGTGRSSKGNSADQDTDASGNVSAHDDSSGSSGGADSSSNISAVNGGANSEGGGVPKRRGSANPLTLMSKMAGAALSGSERLLTGGSGSSSSGGGAANGVGGGGFVAAKAFQGLKPGFEFKQGHRGLGYYLTTLPVVTAPQALQVEKEAQEEAARTAAGHVLARSEQPSLLERPNSFLNFGDMLGSGNSNNSGSATVGSPTSSSDTGGYGVNSGKPTSSSSGGGGGRNAESNAASEMHQGLLSAAANEHFERLVLALVKSAPLLSQPSSSTTNDTSSTENNNNNGVITNAGSNLQLAEQWQRILVDLAHRVCATVDPDVRKLQDLLDIRAYVKIKTIPGGRMNECAYVDGVVFRKHVVHKKMVRSVRNPKVLLLSGGVEFQRGGGGSSSTMRMASFDTLMEQERHYIQILVEKIVALKPDLVLVGHAVSRPAQEWLELHDVTVLQHVKQKLLRRVARSTGATILTSTDQLGNHLKDKASPLGRCALFATLAVPSPKLESSMAEKDGEEQEGPGGRSLKGIAEAGEEETAAGGTKGGQGGSKGSVKDAVSTLVRGPHLKRERGHGFVNYVYLEGCPTDLGCTLVLRGASKAALKQAKHVMRFAVLAAYNLRLEQSYLNNRAAFLPESTSLQPLSPPSSLHALMQLPLEARRRLLSTSLAVDFGRGEHKPPARLLAAGAGSGLAHHFTSGTLGGPAPGAKLLQTSAYEHQSILVTSVWMANRVQCAPAEVKRILYYTAQDLGLGQFLLESCFNTTLKFHGERRSVLDVTQMFSHHTGRLSISVFKMDSHEASIAHAAAHSRYRDPPSQAPRTGVRMWSYCKKCARVVTPVTLMEEDTWKFSFGKFLEVSFYNQGIVGRTGGCQHAIQTEHVLFFGYQNLAARFEYETVIPYDIFTHRQLPLNVEFQKKLLMNSLEALKDSALGLFQSFGDKTNELEERAKEIGRADLGSSSSGSSASSSGNGEHDKDEANHKYSGNGDGDSSPGVVGGAATGAASSSSDGNSNSSSGGARYGTAGSDSSGTMDGGSSSSSSYNKSSSGSSSGTSTSRSDFLQVVLSELGQIQSEVHHSRVLLDKKLAEEREQQERENESQSHSSTSSSSSSQHGESAAATAGEIGGGDEIGDSTSNNHNNSGHSSPVDGLAERLMFPVLFRRNLYMRSLSWNERLSVVGHLMEAVHKSNLHIGMGGGRHDSYGSTGLRSEEELIEEHQARLAAIKRAMYVRQGAAGQGFMLGPGGSSGGNGSGGGGGGLGAMPWEPTSPRSTSGGGLNNNGNGPNSSSGSSSLLPSSIGDISASLLQSVQQAMGGDDDDLDEDDEAVFLDVMDPNLDDPRQHVTPPLERLSPPPAGVEISAGAPGSSSGGGGGSGNRSKAMSLHSQFEEAGLLPGMEPPLSSQPPPLSSSVSPPSSLPGEPALLPPPLLSSSNTTTTARSVSVGGEGLMAAPVPDSADSPTPSPPAQQSLLPPATAASNNNLSGSQPRPQSLPLSSSSSRRIPSTSGLGSTGNAAAKLQSAIGKLLGKDVAEEDHWKVPLGEFAEGRPGLEPGKAGVVLVFEDQPTSIIAYSLSSTYYTELFDEFAASDRDDHKSSSGGGGSDREDDRHDDDDGDGSQHQQSALRSSSISTASSFAASSLLSSTLSEGQQLRTPMTANDLNQSQPGLPALDPVHNNTTAPAAAESNSMDLNNSNNSGNLGPEANMSRSSSASGTSAGSEDSPRAHGYPNGPSGGGSGGGSNGGRSGGTAPGVGVGGGGAPGMSELEAQMMSPQKSHIKHRFADVDEKGNTLCKFMCHTFWATQFAAVRRAFLGEPRDVGFLQSLGVARQWDAQGGKSGAVFLKSSDGRFVVKQITRTELQMFLDYAPAYFEYMAKHFFHGMETVLCKVLGVYTIGYQNRVTGKRYMEQVVVMQNLFYERVNTRIFDLKGSARSRYVRVDDDRGDELSPSAGEQPTSSQADSSTTYETTNAATSYVAERSASGGSAASLPPSRAAADGSGDQPVGGDSDSRSGGGDYNDSSSGNGGGGSVSGEKGRSGGSSSSSSSSSSGAAAAAAAARVLLDDNFMEFTEGRPLPLHDRAKEYFNRAVLNDTLFLSIINVVDYSILVGMDEQRNELVVGIIDYMRQYDIIKRMERMGKSVGMIAGQAEPTIIQPPAYRNRFQNAMQRYFMMVPDKWTPFHMQALPAGPAAIQEPSAAATAAAEGSGSEGTESAGGASNGGGLTAPFESTDISSDDDNKKAT